MLSFQLPAVCDYQQFTLGFITSLIRGTLQEHCWANAIIIYINDMRMTCQFSKTFLFADNAKLCKSIPNVTDSTLLQHDLHNLQVWSLEHHLQFTLSINWKFNTTYTIDSQPLPQLDSHCDLGALLSTDLTWSTHLDHISSKAYELLGLLRCTLMNCYSTDTKKQLYILLVRSSWSNKIRKSYFVRLPRLWNSFPPIDFNQSFSSIKTYVYNYLLKHFEADFNQFNPFSFHYLCTCSNC